MLDLHEEIPSVEFAHQSISKMDTLFIWIQAWVQVEITMDKGISKLFIYLRGLTKFWDHSGVWPGLKIH